MHQHELNLSQRAGRSMAALESLISQHKVVSFDVFDTLLCRKTWLPEDIFACLERRHAQPGFAKARKKAEAMARKRFGSSAAPEVTLEQIYEVLNELAPLNPITPNMELSVEGELLTRDPAVHLLFEAARRRGKRVIGTSDMYLSGAQITGLLRQQGIELDALYCSSDYREEGLGKLNRRIFARVAQTEEVWCPDILHFGDNIVADVTNATATGVTGIHIRARRDLINATKPPFIIAPSDNLSASMVVGQIALAAPFLGRKEPPLYTHGYAMGGPLLLGFCRHILRLAREQGVKRLNLLARDGYIIEDALNILKPKDISYRVMPLSRRMAIFPVARDDEALAEKFIFSALSSTQSPRAFWRQLGLDPDDLPEQDDNDTPMSREAFLNQFREPLFAAADIERKALELHLAEWIGDDPSSVALVDVGWGLSSFRALDKIASPKFPAWFVGIQESAYYRDGFCGYLFDHGAPEGVEAAMNLEILELLFSDPRPSFGRLRLEGDRAVPQHQENSKEDTARNAAVDEVRRGALDFVRDIAWALDDLNDDELVDFNRTAYIRLIFAPKRREYAALAEVPHSRTSGHNHWDTIGDFWRPESFAAAPPPPRPRGRIYRAVRKIGRPLWRYARQVRRLYRR